MAQVGVSSDSRFRQQLSNPGGIFITNESRKLKLIPRISHVLVYFKSFADNISKVRYEKYEALIEGELLARSDLFITPFLILWQFGDTQMYIFIQISILTYHTFKSAIIMCFNLYPSSMRLILHSCKTGNAPPPPSNKPCGAGRLHPLLLDVSMCEKDIISSHAIAASRAARLLQLNFKEYQRYEQCEQDDDGMLSITPTIRDV